MGTPDFAATILDEVIRAGHEILAVVTQPDKQKGRGQAVSFPPVKELALKYGLPIYQPVKVKEEAFLETIRQLQPEVILVAAFGQILPKALLNIPKYGCINVHASLLPKYRGSAPIQYSILEGEEETGITIMYMDVGIDTGDMILQDKLVIAPEETGGSLHDKLAVLGAELLLRALVDIEAGTAIRTPQDGTKATHVKMIDKEMGRIDFTWPAIRIERLIRGLNPWPSAFTSLHGKSLKLWQARVGSQELTECDEYRLAQLGEVTRILKDALVIKTGEGTLVVTELQLEGKKRMPVDAFLRGYPITVGTKFGEE